MRISRYAPMLGLMAILFSQPVLAQEAKENENKKQTVVENKHKPNNKPGLAKWEKEVIQNLDLLQNMDLLENMELIEDLSLLQGDIR